MTPNDNKRGDKSEEVLETNTCLVVANVASKVNRVHWVPMHVIVVSLTNIATKYIFTVPITSVNFKSFQFQHAPTLLLETHGGQHAHDLLDSM